MYYLLLILVITLQFAILFVIYSKEIKDVKDNILKEIKSEKRDNFKSKKPLVSSMKGIVKSKVKPKSLNEANVRKVLAHIRSNHIPFSFYEGTGQLTFLHKDEIVFYFFTTGTLLHRGNKEVNYSVDKLISEWLS